MPTILVLESPFFASNRAAQREAACSILGNTPISLLRYASRANQWKFIDLVSFDEEETSAIENSAEEAIVVAEGAFGLNEDLLFRFYSSDQKVLKDYQGRIGACKIQSAQISALVEKPVSFPEFVSSLSDEVVSAESDPILDELFLEVPVVESVLDLQIAEKFMAQSICYAWMEKGVRIDEPTLARIAPQVEIGPGTWIRGMVRIMGQTVIGKDCLITENSEIVDSTIGDRVKIWTSVLESSEMANDSNIGPYSHLRPGVSLGERVHIGNFVELKKASMGAGSKAGHLAYIGDATVGRDVNVSCGVIFCNYDGKKKHHVTVGDRAFLGSNANIVSPVSIAEEGFIAAGSTITKDLEEGALFVERAEPKTIPGYVKKRKEKGTL